MGHVTSQVCLRAHRSPTDKEAKWMQTFAEQSELEDLYVRHGAALFSSVQFLDSAGFESFFHVLLVQNAVLHLNPKPNKW